MSAPRHVTPQNLKFLRSEKGLNQEDIAVILGIERVAVSKIETGKRALSDAERKLLDWFFFNRLPIQMNDVTVDLSSVLEFDEAEWRIISLLSKKAGFPHPHQWIAAQIHAYLDHHPKAQQVKNTLDAGQETPGTAAQEAVKKASNK